MRRSPALLWATVSRCRTSPSLSTTHTAWLSLAQSIPPVGAGPGGFASVRLIVASPLLHQWGSTWRFRDTAAGRSLNGARWRIALWPVGVSRAVGPRRTHAGPRRSSEQGDGPTVTGAPESSSDRA